MRPPPPARWRLQALGAALGVVVTIGFTLQLLGGPLRHSPSPPCHAHTHVVFLKPHKAAGSSVLNLLLRFGHRRRLRLALPLRYQFGYPRPFRARSVKGFAPRAPPFDIIGHHMRFDRREVQRVMPNDSFYFSILRDPATLAESAFAYYRAVSPAFRNAPSFQAFLEQPERYYRAGLKGNHYAKNLQWFDLGLPPVNDSRSLEWALDSLERSFSLLLLAEYFDESLVLLRDALCWSEEDVTTFIHNAREANGVPKLSQAQAQRLRLWNDLDWALYVRANRSFWRRLEAFGASRMEREVSRLRRRREEASRRCLHGGGPIPASAIGDAKLRPFQPPGSARILGYRLREGLSREERERCARMATPELQYKDILDRWQFGNGSGMME